MAKKEKTTRNFALRLDSETMEAIEKWATDEFRSVNGQIQWVLDQALKKNGRLKRVNLSAMLILSDHIFISRLITSRFIFYF